MKSSRGRRLGFVLSVVLLLVTLAPGVQAAPLEAQWSSQAAATIGTNSCQGVDACLNLTGNVGDNSCNGADVCRGVTGNVGDNSCNAFDSACRDRSANVGNGSCNDTSACRAAPGASIGDGSCNGFEACRDLQVTVGNNSCNGGNAVCRQKTSPIGDCQFNTVTPAECAQPDARIRRIGKHNMVGNDIYNSDGTDQTLSDTLGDRRVRFVITIQNDSDTASSFTIGSSNGVTLIPLPPVNFYHGWQPAQDITAAVMAGTYTTPAIAPGGVYRIRAVVRPLLVNINQRAAGLGFHFSWLVTATTVGNPSKVDAVRFEVDVPIT